MKRLSYTIGILLLLIYSCDSALVPENGAKQTINLELSATMPEFINDSSETKSSISYVTRLEWTKGDKISVINLTKGKVLGGHLTAESDGTTTVFSTASGSLTGSIEDGDKLMFLYPCQDNTSEEIFNDIILNFASQDGSSSSKVMISLYYVGTVSGSSEDFSMSTSKNTFKFLEVYNYMALSSLPKSKTIQKITIKGIPTRIHLSWNPETKDVDFAHVIQKNDAEEQTEFITLSSSKWVTNEYGAKAIYYTSPYVVKNTGYDRIVEVSILDNGNTTTYSSKLDNYEDKLGYNYRTIVSNFQRTDATELSLTATFPQQMGTFDTERQWKAGDEISVVNLSTGELLQNTLVASSAGVSTTLSGSVFGDNGVNAGDKLMLLYPAVGNESNIDFTNSPIIYDMHSQDGKLANIPMVIAAECTYGATSAEFAHVTSVARITADLSGTQSSDTSGDSGSSSSGATGNLESYLTESGSWGDGLNFTADKVEIMYAPASLMLSYDNGGYKISTIIDQTNICLNNAKISVEANTAAPLYLAVPAASSEGTMTTMAVKYFDAKGNSYTTPTKQVNMKLGTYYTLDF